jgi:hypothetical protein
LPLPKPRSGGQQVPFVQTASPLQHVPSQQSIWSQHVPLRPQLTVPLGQHLPFEHVSFEAASQQSVPHFGFPFGQTQAPFEKLWSGPQQRATVSVRRQVVPRGQQTPFPTPDVGIPGAGATKQASSSGRQQSRLAPWRLQTFGSLQHSRPHFSPSQSGTQGGPGGPPHVVPAGQQHASPPGGLSPFPPACAHMPPAGPYSNLPK